MPAPDWNSLAVLWRRSGCVITAIPSDSKAGSLGVREVDEAWISEGAAWEKVYVEQTAAVCWNWSPDPEALSPSLCSYKMDGAAESGEVREMGINSHWKLNQQCLGSAASEVCIHSCLFTCTAIFVCIMRLKFCPSLHIFMEIWEMSLTLWDRVWTEAPSGRQTAV